MVSGLHKLDALTRVLESEKFDAMLVFVRTKIETVDLAQRLEARGFSASALNGDMEQRQREQTIAQLKNGKIDIVIATDVAARGLDVERISHVRQLRHSRTTPKPTCIASAAPGVPAARATPSCSSSPRERNMLRVIERVTRQQLEEMKMPSVADVNELRVVKFKEKITAAVLSGAGKEFQSLLEQIETEGNIPAIEIAAALASMVQGSTPLFLAQKPQVRATEGAAAHRRQRADADLPHRSGPCSTACSPATSSAPSPTRPGIEGRNIGHIDIRDDHSYVDLPGLPDEMIASLQDVRVRGEAIRIQRVDSKPDKPKFSGKSTRPDRMASEERGERRPYEGGKRPYIGGGNRFDKAGEPRPYESRRSESRNYKGTPRFKRDEGSAPPLEGAERPERPRFERADKPAFGGKPRFAGKPSFGGKPSFKKVAASRSRMVSRRNSSARRPAPRAPTRAARRFATSRVEFSTAGVAPRARCHCPRRSRGRRCSSKYSPHVLEHVAVHLRPCRSRRR